MNILDMGISGIKCDAEGCGYENMFGSWGSTPEEILAMNQEWLNKPCPECGANLLTPEDAKLVEGLVQMAGLVNDLGNSLQAAHPELFEGMEDDPRVPIEVTTDGSGNPTFIINTGE